MFAGARDVRGGGGHDRHKVATKRWPWYSPEVGSAAISGGEPALIEEALDHSQRVKQVDDSKGSIEESLGEFCRHGHSCRCPACSGATQGGPDAFINAPGQIHVQTSARIWRGPRNLPKGRSADALLDFPADEFGVARIWSSDAPERRSSRRSQRSRLHPDHDPRRHLARRLRRDRRHAPGRQRRLRGRARRERRAHDLARRRRRRPPGAPCAGRARATAT